MQDMMKMYAPDMAGMPCEATLILNRACPLIERLERKEFGDKTEQIAKHVYSLALLSQRTLTADEMNAFLRESYDILNTIG